MSREGKSVLFRVQFFSPCHLGREGERSVGMRCETAAAASSKAAVSAAATFGGGAPRYLARVTWKPGVDGLNGIAFALERDRGGEWSATYLGAALSTAEERRRLAELPTAREIIDAFGGRRRRREQ